MKFGHNFLLKSFLFDHNCFLETEKIENQNLFKFPFLSI